MPDLLGVTNPVPSYENTRAIPVSPNDTQIQNVPDPSRVGRPDARTDRQDSGDTKEFSAPRYGSNFQTFLQRLRDTPDLMESMTRLVFGRQGSVVTSGLSEGLAADMARFLEMLKLDQSQLEQFLLNQLTSSTRFGGALFALLRDTYAGSGMESLRDDILQFIKRFSDYSSTAHIEGNLLRNLNRMAGAIPASWANRLQELIGQLQNGMAAGDRAGNLKLLQGQIIPLLGEYTSRTHDMGTARTLLTMLTLDVSRYENGSEDGLIQAFRQLSNYAVLKQRLGGMDDEGLLRMLRNTAYARASQENQFADSLAQAAMKAMRGEGGADLQEAFRAIVQAYLVNESVYMPLTHLMIPLDFNGNLMFSELWVDPDAERKEESPREGGEGPERTVRFLLKMDIQRLGFFDMVLSCRGETVDLRVCCPPLMAPFSELVGQQLTRILADNGLKPTAVRVERMEKPLTISQVFPRLFDGRRSVDVRI